MSARVWEQRVFWEQHTHPDSVWLVIFALGRQGGSGYQFHRLKALEWKSRKTKVFRNNMEAVATSSIDYGLGREVT